MTRAARRPARAALLALGLVSPWAGAVAAQDVPVAPSDLLRLRVLDWDAVAGEVREWPEVSGEYVVGTDGAIAVPFAGRVPSAGRLPEEIAADVVTALRERLALTEPPDATVEVAAWRPVIVTGDVRAPGPVDFAPGLVALQAVGLAGGAGAATSSDAALRREVAAAQTSLAVLRGEELRLLARDARLEAELSGADAVASGAGQGAEWEAVLALETQLLRIRRDRLARELAAIGEEVALFEAEIDALTQKVAALERQRALADDAAAGTEDLAARGLVANQRLFESERVLASIESQLLDVSTATLTARQNIAGAERERAALQDSRLAEVLELRQEADARLAETRQRIAGQLAVLDALDASEGLDAGAEPRIAVLRAENGALRRIEDAGLLPLLPGDMVEVTRPRLPPGGLPADATVAAAPPAAGPIAGPVAEPVAGPVRAALAEPIAAALGAPARAPLPGAAAPRGEASASLAGGPGRDAAFLDAQPMAEPPAVSPVPRPGG